MTREQRLDADALPRRVAHATFALVFRPLMAHDYGPFTAAEVCEFDGPEAYTPQHTGAALREAAKLGLAMYIPSGGGLWTATNYALDNKQALEDRFLRDTEDA